MVYFYDLGFPRLTAGGFKLKANHNPGPSRFRSERLLL